MKLESSAVAYSFRKGKSLADTWAWLTAMFRDPSAQAYVTGNQSLDPVKNNQCLGVGAVFKWSTVQWTEMYLEIVEWELEKSFAFIEVNSPTTGEFVKKEKAMHLVPPTMKFTLESHYEGTKVFIYRKEFQNLNLIHRLFGEKFNRNTAVGRLAYILSGTSVFVEGASWSNGSWDVKRA